MDVLSCWSIVENNEVVVFGLVLDVFYFYIIEFGIVKYCQYNELVMYYDYQQVILLVLVNKFKDLYLLVSISEEYIMLVYDILVLIIQ